MVVWLFVGLFLGLFVLPFDCLLVIGGSCFFSDQQRLDSCLQFFVDERYLYLLRISKHLPKSSSRANLFFLRGMFFFTKG